MNDGAWLEIVQVLHCTGYLYGKLDNDIGREGALADELAQRFPFRVLHHEEHPFCLKRYAMQLDDVWVRKMIMQSGLTDDCLVDVAHQTGVIVDGLLDGHKVAIVLGSVHLPEATLPHQTLKPEVLKVYYG